ncbi:uncharacterized protein LOC142363531 isoform X2 [Opisthocomus hoazin]|uniref:uncharacterized protein LOC142363531 isoform X2 n=1 Tax=Opisthocomus hoazin TaxID=30419 RepID=UPI003F538043
MGRRGAAGERGWGGRQGDVDAAEPLGGSCPRSGEAGPGQARPGGRARGCGRAEPPRRALPGSGRSRFRDFCSWLLFEVVAVPCYIQPILWSCFLGTQRKDSNRLCFGADECSSIQEPVKAVNAPTAWEVISVSARGVMSPPRMAPADISLGWLYGALARYGRIGLWS